MIDVRPLIKPSFWFELQPDALTPSSEQMLFIFFGALVILGAITRILARHRRKDDKHLVAMYKKVGQMLLTMGILGLTIFFFAFERLYFIGARFWFLLWGIGLIVWIVQIVRFAKVTVPAKRQAQLKGREQERYMPRKK